MVKIFTFPIILYSLFFILALPTHATNCCQFGTPQLFSGGVACGSHIAGYGIAPLGIHCPNTEPNCDINTKQCCISGPNCYSESGIAVDLPSQNAPPAPNPVQPSENAGRTGISEYECMTFGNTGDPANPAVPIAPGIKTALGCLSYYPEFFIRQILPWSIRLAGGVAFFLILLAAFQHTTATGDPEKMKSAQELLTSAVSGLLIILFATVLLYTIGVDILGLSSLGF